MKSKMALVLVLLALLGTALFLYFSHETPSPVVTTPTPSTNLVAPPPHAIAQTRTNGLSAKRDATQKKISKLKISTPVASIVGLDPQNATYNGRVKALHQLTRRLSEDDCKALQMFLAGGMSGKNTLKPLEFDGVKNDVLGILLKQEKIPDGLSQQFVDMYHDTGNDATWRDYCLQYMVPCYDVPASTDTNAATLRQDIEKSFWDAVTEKNKTTAGTSLICLETLSKTHPDIDRAKVAATAYSLATDETCGEATRITALGTCAVMGKTEILATAKALAQTGDTIPLRMAAIAAVGDLGTTSDAELLRALSADSEKRISFCSRAALDRLNKRFPVQAL